MLEGGALTGAEPAHALAGGVDRASTEYLDKRRQAERLDFLVEDGRQTLPQAAIRFALEQPEVSAVLVGFSDMKHMDEAAGAVRMGPPRADHLVRIKELHQAGALA